ncbi:large conductance mechanosensitive channel protein MscL [Agathobacter ruminis]|uniref:Large-conductance mechanosensitive channel n=1 Tax=Agathobacter ruminis TaxID=1712665 RepID=A0A2G3E2H4_9FIRM|nr:large conductance mechanosensitive channel protein MscL [Agathobacter ruminis]MDC7301022.1 large conductance mechanosensitive channel protein MscL [Agathobacter ruminis]PHU37472.1 large conductance mechanosensitive channel protein MscL [Agathobacter ruminis]
MKKFAKEFKDFISRGNVMDMAVGIIIGSAFTAIVNSLVADIINPILGIFGGLDFSGLSVKLRGDSVLTYGNFITAILNFLIMALIVFLIVKALNKAATIGKKKEDGTPAEPTEKECPYCKSMIPIGATKCAHCTSDLS